MPNGDPDFGVKQKPELERFFGVIGTVLEEFAGRHNLRIEKYYHQSPSWDFLFRHPKGGVGKIGVERSIEATVHIRSIWWYDDYDAATRFTRSASVGPVPLNPELADGLEKALSKLLSWRFGDWHERHTAYTSWRETWTRETVSKTPG